MSTHFLSQATDWPALHGTLGIPADYAAQRRLQPCPQASILMPLGVDALGRDQFADPSAAVAWLRMQDAAADSGITLQLVSVFRSISYQAGLIRRKLDQGQPLADILRVSAAPGFSEHHGGCAFDLTTPGFEMLETVFEDSPAFAWLQSHAAAYGFVMSYPRDNPQGFIYEPWHWCYQPATIQTASGETA